LPNLLSKPEIADQRLGVLYASTTLSGKPGFELLHKAVGALLSTVDVTPAPHVLWSIQYQQRPSSGSETLPVGLEEHVMRFPPQSLDLAFDDSTFDRVKQVWEKIMGDDAGDFLVFQDREAYDDDDG
jgi:hypothetical protein